MGSLGSARAMELFKDGSPMLGEIRSLTFYFHLVKLFVFISPCWF